MFKATQTNINNKIVVKLKYFLLLFSIFKIYFEYKQCTIIIKKYENKVVYVAETGPYLGINIKFNITFNIAAATVTNEETIVFPYVNSITEYKLYTNNTIIVEDNNGM